MNPLLNNQPDDGIDIDIRTTFAISLTNPLIDDRYAAVANMANQQAAFYFTPPACEAYSHLVKLSLAMIPNLWMFTAAVYQALVEALGYSLPRTERFFRNHDIYRNVKYYRNTLFPTAEAVKLLLLVRDHLGLPNNAVFLRKTKPQGGDFPLERAAQKLGVSLPVRTHGQGAPPYPSAKEVAQAMAKLQRWYRTTGFAYDSKAAWRTLAYRAAAGLMNTRTSLRLDFDEFGDFELYRAVLRFNIPLPPSRTNHKVAAQQ